MSIVRLHRLSSGHQVGSLELGNPQGPVCFFFHGFPGSSKQVGIVQLPEFFRKYRLIALDRAGFGDSSFNPDRQITDVAKDVAELADSMGIQKFHLLSVSGGTPSAYIIGDRLRDRVLSLTTVCGLGPLHESAFVKLMPGWARFFLRVGKRSIRSASLLLGAVHWRIQKGNALKKENLEKIFAPVDAALMADDRIRSGFKESMGHAFKQGPSSVAFEVMVFQQDWKISNWNFPFPVRIWHGRKDHLVPYQHSEMLAKRIPGAELHLLPEEGHYSLPLTCINEILKPLL